MAQWQELSLSLSFKLCALSTLNCSRECNAWMWSRPFMQKMERASKDACDETRKNVNKKEMWNKQTKINQRNQKPPARQITANYFFSNVTMFLLPDFSTDFALFCLPICTGLGVFIVRVKNILVLTPIHAKLKCANLLPANWNWISVHCYFLSMFCQVNETLKIIDKRIKTQKDYVHKHSLQKWCYTITNRVKTRIKTKNINEEWGNGEMNGD